MSRRTLKKIVVKALANPNWSQVTAVLEKQQPGELLNPLFSALCSINDTIRWNAIRSFGWLVPRIADQDMETARIVMRRFIWSLNDESGGIGWGAPEAMAEIIATDQRFAREYLHMLLSYMQEDGPELYQDGNFLELPQLQRGLLWGLGRVCDTQLETLHQKNVIQDLLPYLESKDTIVKGLAVWCLGKLGDSSGLEIIERINSDTIVPIFIEEKINSFTMDELVAQYKKNLTPEPAT